MFRAKMFNFCLDSFQLLDCEELLLFSTKCLIADKLTDLFSSYVVISKTHENLL